MSARPAACLICGALSGLRPVLQLHSRTMRPVVPERQERDYAQNPMWVCSSPTRECIRRGAERQRRLAEVAEIKRGPRRDRGERRGRSKTEPKPKPAGKCATCEGLGHPFRVRSRGGSGKATYSRIACASCGGTGLARRARP